MKRLLPLLALSLLFAGCGIDSVGFPTVKINVQKTELIPPSGNVTTYKRSVTLEFRTLPGSPAGTIKFFTTQNGDQFPAGVYVDSCATSSAKDCGPYTSNITWIVPDPTNEAKVILLNYSAENNNGASKDFQIPGNGIALNY